MSYRDLSLWWDTLPDGLRRAPGGSATRPALDAIAVPGDEVDVAIVGAGYTGLWTAYYLARADPALRILVIEAQTAGFGASGRNGGWCSALFPSSADAVARRYGHEAAVALNHALQDTVQEVGRVSDAEGIDCHFSRSGTVVLARTPVQLSRARADVAQAQRYGADLRLLHADEARAYAGATNVLGGTYTPHCASIHPARLVRGLALAAERAGVRIVEDTVVTAIEPGAGPRLPVVRTERGTVRAQVVVRATEGFTARLGGQRRALAPIYSLMLATEPLPASLWERIGLARRETFTDYRHLIVYGQRTADDRLAFGGRGAPYHYGSRTSPGYDRDAGVHAGLEHALRELFPAVRGAITTHRWGGPLGVPRDWFASVGLDRSTGLAWAGGYVGDGVGAANLAGRTLRDLVLAGLAGREADTGLSALPWASHRSPGWEPEPARWLGVNLGLWAMGGADAEELRTGRHSRRAQIFGRFVGH